MLASGSALAPPVLQELLAAGHEVCGLVTPGDAALRRLPPRRVLLAVDVADHALGAGVPVWRSPDARAAERVLEELRPSLVVVACLPWRLGPAWWDLALNVHPSLLPAFRGRDPVTAQRGAQAPMGVSVHYVSAEMDAGDLVTQQGVDVPAAATHEQAEALLGRAGGRLLAAALLAGPLPRRPQGR
jgi:methionyl-tRNA formyltransferase